MNEISKKAIKLINDLRRDISIDIMFTPEKNAEDDSLKALADYIAELEAFVDKLIEVGHKSVNFVEGFCNTYGNERPKYWHDWKALEDDWKERER